MDFTAIPSHPEPEKMSMVELADALATMKHMILVARDEASSPIQGEDHAHHIATVGNLHGVLREHTARRLRLLVSGEVADALGLS